MANLLNYNSNKNPSSKSYFSFGLFFWAVPILLSEVPVYGIYGILCAIILYRLPNLKSRRIESNINRFTIYSLLIILISYIFFDQAYGRGLLNYNMFLHKDAVSDFIALSNDQGNNGRTFGELFANVLIFTPFFLIDVSYRGGKLTTPNILILFISIFSVFYETGISRGQFLISALALGSPYVKKTSHLILLLILGVISFIASSFFRGDFEYELLGNPLFDAYYFPVINFELLVENSCNGLGAQSYLGNYLNKFLPGSLFDKSIFQYNIELTKCIYPFMSNRVDSISIFTWVSELYVYEPFYVVMFFIVVILYFYSFVVDYFTQKYELRSVSVFIGLMSIVFLRSRTLDLFSYLTFFVAFMLVVELLNKVNLSVKQSSDESEIK